MAEYFNNKSLLGHMVKWKTHLIIVTVAAIAISALFSSPLFIPPKYRSFAVLYPANIIPMGSETPTEQMLQVLESDDIKQEVIEAYDLVSHYQIDSTKPHYQTLMLKSYEENVRIKKTEYESVVVEVFDTDAVKAKMMTESIISFFNRKERLLQKEKAMEVVKILSTQLNRKKAEMDSMEAKTQEIREKYGILDYDLQTEYVTERYLQVITGTSAEQARAKEIEPILKNLETKGGEFLALNEHLWRIRGNYNDLKEQYEGAVRDVEKQLTYANIVTQPRVSDKKAYPIRWLIVLVSAISTLILALIVISSIENYKEVKDLEN